LEIKPTLLNVNYFIELKLNLVQRPASELIRALESFKNKSLFYKEYELNMELNHLKNSEANLNKRLNGLNSKASVNLGYLNNVRLQSLKF